MTLDGFLLSSCSSAISAKLLSLLSDMDARRRVLMRRIVEKLRSALADATGSVVPRANMLKRLETLLASA